MKNIYYFSHDTNASQNEKSSNQKFYGGQKWPDRLKKG